MTRPQHGAVILPDGRTIERPAFLLDLDGTLIDIAATPDAVIVPPDLPRLLLQLRARHADAVAIVSGRPIEAVDALLGHTPYAVAGEHGAALRLAAGRPVLRDPLPVLPAEVVARAAAAAAGFPGALVERKAHGVALHYRLAPQAEAALREAAEAIVAACPGFSLLRGSMTWEVRPAGVHKGHAVRALMAAPPFAGRVPLFVGDDVTDEDAIAAAVALGGAGLLVGEAFGSPAAVRRWLEGA
ncbi:MAG: trehalose-phosphatase [Rhodospirillales bacterium]|nr:trehalose-phosphatase [Rhodospirillales bacterium]